MFTFTKLTRGNKPHQNPTKNDRFQVYVKICVPRGPADARSDTKWCKALNQYRESLTPRDKALYHVKTPPRSKDISKIRVHLRNVWFYHKFGQKRGGSWWGSRKYYWTLMECIV